jgi:hypothetical protein
MEEQKKTEEVVLNKFSQAELIKQMNFHTETYTHLEIATSSLEIWEDSFKGIKADKITEFLFQVGDEEQTATLREIWTLLKGRKIDVSYMQLEIAGVKYRFPVNGPLDQPGGAEILDKPEKAPQEELELEPLNDCMRAYMQYQQAQDQERLGFRLDLDSYDPRKFNEMESDMNYMGWEDCWNFFKNSEAQQVDTGGLPERPSPQTEPQALEAALTAYCPTSYGGGYSARQLEARSQKDFAAGWKAAVNWKDGV